MTRELKWPSRPSSTVEIRDPNEHIQKHWMLGAYYEANGKGMLNYIYRNHDPGLVYVDVGASIGNHTLFFLNVMQAERVVAIEPYKPSYDHMRFNVALNGFNSPQFSSVNNAVSDHERLVSMESYHESNNVGMKRITTGDDVRAVQLDSILQYENRIDIIKIDVEHHGWELLHGAKDTLASREAVIYIECGNDVELAEADLLLGRFGYDRTPGVRLNYTATYEYAKP